MKDILQVIAIATGVTLIAYLMAPPIEAKADTHNVMDSPYSASCDDSADDTAEIQEAIDAAETAGGGTVLIPAGKTCRHTGLTLTKGITLSGENWSSVLKNTSSSNHSIYKAAGLSVASERIVIQDLDLKHTGGGSSVDGIHIEEANNYLTINRVKIEDARRDGISLLGLETSQCGNLYAFLTENMVEGSGRDGISLNGGVNNVTIIGGRSGSNVGYGLKVNDTLTENPTKFPNTLRVMSLDLAGNGTGLFDGGHSNMYIGVRFEDNDTEIEFGSDHQSGVFIGTSYSDSTIITGTPAARPIMLDKAHYLRFFQDNGVLEYWDEPGAAVKKLPKRSYFTFTMPATAAASGTIDWPLARLQDTIKITRISLIPAANITGANTNNFRVCLRTAKVGGSDNAIACQQFTSGVNWTALADNSLTVDTDQDDRVNGDRLYMEKNEYGTGMASPIMSVQVEYQG